MSAGFDHQFAKPIARDPVATGRKLTEFPASCALAAEAAWEEYALGLLSEQDCEPLEEHLLMCPACQRQLAETDEYIRAAKAALLEMRGLSKPVAVAISL